MVLVEWKENIKTFKSAISTLLSSILPKAYGLDSYYDHSIHIMIKAGSNEDSCKKGLVIFLN
jgi:hypothetical protein